MVVSRCLEMLPSMGKPAQPSSYVCLAPHLRSELSYEITKPYEITKKINFVFSQKIRTFVGNSDERKRGAGMS